MAKARVNIHVTDEVALALDQAARRPGATKAAIVDAALAAYLSPESNDRRDGALIRRLDRFDRRAGRLERATNVLLETFALFLRHFFLYAPDFADAERKAAAARGAKRLSDFIDELGLAIASEKSFKRFLMDEFEAREGDFFASEEIAALKEARARNGAEA
ncbi:MAG: hypothetical protein AB7P23_11815 [Amphiplicatus sp.]